MKKPKRTAKLTVARETLQALATPELRQVAGAEPTVHAPRCILTQDASFCATCLC